jgi:hypothetical protein
MRLDDLARDAGRALLDEAHRATRPPIAAIRSVRRRRTGFFAGGVGFAGTLALVGGLLSLGGGDEPPVATSPTTVSTTLVDVTTTAPSGEAWRRVPHDEPVFGGNGDQLVEGIAAGRAGLVAVGIDYGRAEVNEDDLSVVWTSPDGETWHRIDDEPDFFDTRMRDVAWFDEGGAYVAVGSDESEGSVWMSPDGISWEQVAVFPIAPGGGIGLNSVAATGSGVVAAGEEWLSAGERVAATWLSADARTWSRFDPEAPISSAIVDVAAADDVLWAAGTNETYAGDLPAVWRSTDAVAWDGAHIRGPDLRFELNAIATQDDVVVTVGGPTADEVAASAFWSDDDGATWTPVPLEGGTGSPTLHDVIATADGWVAAGFDTETTALRTIAAVWRSADGKTWHRVDPFTPTFLPGDSSGVVMTALIASDTTIVAGGFQGATCTDPFSRCDLDAAFWIWDPRGG